MSIFRKVRLLTIKKNHGFILLPVILALGILAAIAYLLNFEGSINAGNVKQEHQQDELIYIANAGYHHALWQLNRQNCSGYSDIPTTTFANNNYSVAYTDSSGNPANSGSPVNVKVTASLNNGISRDVTHYNIPVFQPPVKITLQPGSNGKDTYLEEWRSSINWGTSTELWVEHQTSNYQYNSLIEFDLSPVPSNAHIVSATLNLYQFTASMAGGPVEIHGITRAWNEGSKNGQSGTPNWTSIATNTQWNTAGGDYAMRVSATTTIPANIAGWYNWDITELVENWLTGRQANNGMALIPKNLGTAARFYSSEAASAATRPKLTIIYACECGKTCTPPAPPAKKIYWTDDNAMTIMRADEDGSNVEVVISNQYKVRGLDIDTVNGKIYWTSNTEIRRANLDGSNIESIYSTSKLNFAVQLDVANGKMYWTYDNLDPEIMRANLDGSQIETLNSASNLPMYFSLDAQAGHIYVTEYGTSSVSRLNVDGSGLTTIVNGNGKGAMGNAIDIKHGKVYWSGGASYDWIKRANLDGSQVETILTGLNAPQDIVYDPDNDRIYWTEALINPVIKRANADGSNAEIIVSNPVRPRAILIVNADNVPSAKTSSCNGTFRDEFNTLSYANNDGSLKWSGNWQEINESNGPSSGDEQITDDNGPYQLRLRDNDKGGEGVEREADLSGATTAILSFIYRRSGLDKSSDYVSLQLSVSGSAGPWTEITRFEGPATDSNYLDFTKDISAFISANTRVRLITSSSMGKSDKVYFDNIQIQCSSNNP